MQPDVTGMVQEPQSLEERLEKIETPKSAKDSNDILYIKNIDMDCSEHTYDVIRITEKWRDTDPEARGRIITRFRDVTNLFEHSEGFTVKWSNQPVTIPPGKVMRLPRYIGEHYASKLADHMLDKRGVEKMLRGDPIERPKVLKQIILKEESFISMMPQTVGEQALADIEALNAPVVTPFVAPDGKTIYNTKNQKSPELSEAEAVATENIPLTTGDVRTKEIEPLENVISRLGTETPEDSLNIPPKWQNTSKEDIIRLIRNMTPDFRFGTNVTKSQLVGILQRNF